MLPKNLTECPYYLISRVTLVVTSALKKEFAVARVAQVKPAYLCVLMSLWREDGPKVIDLGRMAGLEPSTMTGLLDRMERDGLVTRSTDPHDRRVLRIYLTQIGQQVRRSVLMAVDKVLADVFRSIPDDDIAHTKRTLCRVLANAYKGNR
jgi:DNA-binding MarR family transcriptional regulator